MGEKLGFALRHYKENKAEVIEKEVKEMKANKIGSIFLMSVLALAGIGVSYAGFYDEISVYGTVDTATVDVELVDYSCTIVWKIYDWTGTEPVDIPIGLTINIVGEIAIYYGPCLTEAEELDMVDYLDDYFTVLGPISSAHAEQAYDENGEIIDDTVEMTYDNLFPCVDFCADFVFHYVGSIPGRINTAEIFSGDQWLIDLWALHQSGSPYGAWVQAWFVEPIIVNEVIVGWTQGEPVDVGTQLHYCDYVWVELCIHLPQDNELQGLTGTFTGEITVFQWYECENIDG